MVAAAASCKVSATWLGYRPRHHRANRVARQASHGFRNSLARASAGSLSCRLVSQSIKRLSHIYQLHLTLPSAKCQRLGWDIGRDTRCEDRGLNPLGRRLRVVISRAGVRRAIRGSVFVKRSENIKSGGFVIFAALARRVRSRRPPPRLPIFSPDWGARSLPCEDIVTNSA